MVSQTLPRNDLFSRGLRGKRKLWDLPLARLTLISTQSSCSARSSHCAMGLSFRVLTSAGSGLPAWAALA